MADLKVTATPGVPEILISREFDAPRELVFKAYTDPELFKQWMGPRELSIELLKFEPHNGGSWKFNHIDKSGNKFPFHGVFHEVTAPERIIQTFEYDGLPEKGHVILETMRLEELPGSRTKISGQSMFQSMADRDGMLQSGMEGGMKESYDRLEELLKKGVK